MKKLFAVLAVSTFFLTGCGSEANTNLGAQDFQAKTQEAGVVTLDVRTPGEFVSGHLVNALNIDVEGSQFNAEIGKLDKEATYAVYCRSGRRSQVSTSKSNSYNQTVHRHCYNDTIVWTHGGHLF